MSGLATGTASGQVALLYHLRDMDYRATKRLADRPLKDADLSRLIGEVEARVAAAGLLLPNAATLIERAVVALISGHLILEGPPGTGKTTFACILAEAFDCTYSLETATADWSTYDVIGGLQPAVSSGGIEVLQPWLGHVPRAAVRCADVIAQNDDDPTAEPHQGHWLVIDEFNRADIDRAIGQLYTVLGGGGGEERRRLPLWFGDKEETQECWIPDRFRIVGTLNSVDTAYVHTLSQGLQRRFQFVYVGVPEEGQLTDELKAVSANAAGWWAGTFGPNRGDPAAAGADADDLFDQDEYIEATQKLADFVRLVRYGDGDAAGWPIGSAQLLDVMRQVALRARQGSPPASLIPALDLALSDRIVPQMSGLLRAQLDLFEDRLESDFGELPYTLSGLRQVRHASQTAFA